MDIVTLFGDIDEYCQTFEPQYKQCLLHASALRRDKPSTLSLSEVMTIIVWFHQSSYRTCTDYYTLIRTHKTKK